MKTNPTAFTIYKMIAKKLELLFPHRERDISIRINPIPNNLEFHKKGISNLEVSKNMDEISYVYYKIFKQLGEKKFISLHKDNEIFKLIPREYPDRRVNISTVISILHLSGFRNDTLYNRSYEYLTKKSDNNDVSK